MLLAGGAEDGVVGGGREDADGALDRGQEGPRRPGTHFWRWESYICSITTWSTLPTFSVLCGVALAQVAVHLVSLVDKVDDHGRSLQEGQAVQCSGCHVGNGVLVISMYVELARHKTLCDIQHGHPVGTAHAEADVAGVGVEAALLQEGQIAKVVIRPPALLPKFDEVPVGGIGSGHVLGIINQWQALGELLKIC